MKNNVEEIQTVVIDTDTLTGTELSETVSSGVPATKRGGLLSRLPRFSDDKQRRAGGNILKFLALLLVLTLIARGTSAATLPRVDVGTPTRSEIIEAVTGTANVAVRDTLDITAPEGLTIDEMLVGAGQTVKTGDPIAAFNPDEVLESLTRETASLDKLLLDLEKLERGETTDSSSLESARRSLDRAREDYESTRAQGEADIEAARLALEEAWAEQAENPDATSLESARRTLQRAQEDYDATLKQTNADVAAAEDALKEAKSSSVESADTTSLESAERALRRAQEDYNSASAQCAADIATAQSAYDNAKTAYDNDINDPALLEALNKAESALNTAISKANDSMLSASRKVEDAQASYNKALNDYGKSSNQAEDTYQSNVEKAEDALESAKSKAADSMQSAARKLEDAQASYAKAEQDFAKNSTQAYETLISNIEKAEEALASAETKAADNLKSAARKVEDAEASYNKAQQDYGKSARQSADTEASNSISASTLRLDVAAQKEIVDSLELLKANNCVLYADLDGVVSSAKSEGGTTDKNALVSFMDGAKGFEATLQVSKTDAEKLAVGDECEVTTGGGSMYYSPTVTAMVSSISAPDESDKVTVVVRLPDGDWTNGQRIDVQAVQSRNTYELCVPLTALHSDNSGYYLLTVSQHSSVLGVENVVTRIPVTVQASDSDTAAVQGPVGRDSQIITGSSKAIDAGDRVRVNEA